MFGHRWAKVERTLKNRFQPLANNSVSGPTLDQQLLLSGGGAYSYILVNAPSLTSKNDELCHNKRLVATLWQPAGNSSSK